MGFFKITIIVILALAAAFVAFKPLLPQPARVALIKGAESANVAFENQKNAASEKFHKFAPTLMPKLEKAWQFAGKTRDDLVAKIQTNALAQKYYVHFGQVVNGVTVVFVCFVNECKKIGSLKDNDDAANNELLDAAGAAN